MSEPRQSRHAPHWVQQRALLADAARALVSAAQADGHTHGELGLQKGEWERLRTGTAGFPLIVKAAQKLGLGVAVQLYTPDPVQEGDVV